MLVFDFYTLHINELKEIFNSKLRFDD